MSQPTTILLKTTNKILLTGDVPKMPYMSLFLLEPPQSHHQPVDETRGDFLKIIELSLNGLQELAFSSTPWKEIGKRRCLGFYLHRDTWGEDTAPVP